MPKPEIVECPTCHASNSIEWKPGQINFRCHRCASIIRQRTHAEATAPEKRK